MEMMIVLKFIDVELKSSIHDVEVQILLNSCAEREAQGERGPHHGTIKEAH